MRLNRLIHVKKNLCQIHVKNANSFFSLFTK